MDDLENDIKETLARHPGIVWDMASITSAIVKHLTALGYTRTGLTDAQRERAGAYRVEKDDEGCPHCQAGVMSTVVRPDGVALSKSWGDEEEAFWLRDQLNDAAGFRCSPSPTPNPARRVVQVVSTGSDDITALCEDGTIWILDMRNNPPWKKLPPIPGDDA